MKMKELKQMKIYRATMGMIDIYKICMTDRDPAKSGGNYEK